MLLEGAVPKIGRFYQLCNDTNNMIPKYSQIVPSAKLPTINPTQSSKELNPGVSSEKRAINRLSFGKDLGQLSLR